MGKAFSFGVWVTADKCFQSHKNTIGISKMFSIWYFLVERQFF